MASGASLRALVHTREQLVFVGRRLDNAGFVEDADLLNAGLRPDRSYDLIDLVAAIVQHPVARAALYGFGDAIAGSVGRFLQILPMQPNNLVAEHRKIIIIPPIRQSVSFRLRLIEVRCFLTFRMTGIAPVFFSDADGLHAVVARAAV